MYFESNRTLPVVPGWSAEFIFRYQALMSGDGWGLVLHGPGGKVIDIFKDYIMSCGKEAAEWSDEELMRAALSLSKDGRYLKIHGTYDGFDNWTVDLRTGAWLKSKIDHPNPWAEEEEDGGGGDPTAMTRSQVLFNLVGLLVAVLCVVFVGIAWYVFMRDSSRGGPGAWHLVLGYGAFLIGTIGGGSLANFAAGRLSPWPTRLMIAGYCISIILLPLALWGMGAVHRERQRRQGLIVDV